MEFFNEGKVIRLRSRLGKYLLADDDEENVRQSRNASSHKARWTVELVEGHHHIIHLKSCFGKYLTASDESFLLGVTGKKVLQAIPTANNDSSIDWEPIKEGIFVMLRAKSGGKFLRANGGTPPWRNTVTHDVPSRTATQDWVLWEVERVVDVEEDSVKGYLSPASSFSFNFEDPDQSHEYSDSGSPLAIPKEGASLPKSGLAFGDDEGGMEIFQKAKVVRLRSHHDKYLLADEDEETVYQDRKGSYNNARWTVEIVENANVLRIKSCYSKYLTASNVPFLLGATGNKVLQTEPRILDSSVEWEPIREGMQVKLKTRSGQYLRANGGLPPWRNSITHDVPNRTATRDWILWDVDVVELRPQPLRHLTPIPPDLSINSTPTARSPSISPSLSDSGSFARIELRSGLVELRGSDEEGSRVKEGRTIFYDVGDENGDVDDANKEKFFTFKGSCVEELRQKLKDETGLDEIHVYCRNPLNAKLYPLRLQLPPNNTDMHVVVVPS